VHRAAGFDDRASGRGISSEMAVRLAKVFGGAEQG